MADETRCQVRWKRHDGEWSPWIGCTGPVTVHDGVLDMQVDDHGRVLVPLHTIPGVIEVEDVASDDPPAPTRPRLTDRLTPLSSTHGMRRLATGTG